MKNFKPYKTFENLCEGDKVHRKAKKALLGRRVKKCTLNKMKCLVIINPNRRTMWDEPYQNYPLFCHNCGCTQIFGSGNRVSYPEHWESFYCLRCKTKVAEIDNSPLYTTLELEEMEK